MFEYIAAIMALAIIGAMGMVTVNP